MEVGARHGVPKPLVNEIVQMYTSIEISTSVRKEKQRQSFHRHQEWSNARATVESKWRFRRPEKDQRPLGFNRSFYAYDAEIIFLLREELNDGSTLIARLDCSPPHKWARPRKLKDRSHVHPGPEQDLFDSFWYLGMQITPDIQESFDINTRIRDATWDFIATNDLFFNEKSSQRTSTVDIEPL